MYLSSTSIKTQNRAKGNVGEEIAIKYLLGQGFKILVQNYSPKRNYQGGEVDIIAIRDDQIHAIEVKYRTSDTWGMGRESVNFRKQTSIRKITAQYLRESDLLDKISCSHDIIEITKSGDSTELEHFENCF